MGISHTFFGNEQHGKPVTEYTLANNHGAYVSILDFGCVITNIVVPDREGILADVNLGFENAMAYTDDNACMGAVIGRVSNRTANATFELEGHTYKLVANDGVNNLHAGPDGFTLRMWDANPIPGEGIDTLKLTLTSPDGDQGFPGNLTVVVTYTFDDHNKLGIEYIATTDKTTIVNMTNHAYFNLDGHDAPDVRDLELQIFADYVCSIREGLIPDGGMIPQEDLVYGFKKPKRVGDVLLHTDSNPTMKNVGGLDFNYCAGFDRIMKCIAVLYSPKTGREMKVITDMPGMQVYSGQGLHQKGKGGVTYQAFGGMCFETQRYPDAIHQSHFPSVVLRPNEVYYTKTEYVFSVR